MGSTRTTVLSGTTVRALWGRSSREPKTGGGNEQAVSAKLDSEVSEITTNQRV